MLTELAKKRKLKNCYPIQLRKQKNIFLSWHRKIKKSYLSWLKTLKIATWAGSGNKKVLPELTQETK